MNTERGSATVLMATCAGVLLLVALAAAWVTALVADHRSAQSAADLAALAGAQALVSGRSPCPAADVIARANRARATHCSVSGTEVWVTVEVDGSEWFGQAPVVAARAHAGPAP